MKYKTSYRKQLGDIAENMAIVHALKRNYGVSKPVGDNLPYDLIFDVKGCLYKIQVKTASKNNEEKYVVNTRRGKKKEKYQETDFDFALIYVDNLDIFYIMPIKTFLSFSGNLTIVEGLGRGRKPVSWGYQRAWHFLEQKNREEK